MLKMVDGTGIIGVDMICPLGVSTPQPPNYDRVELEGTGILVLPNSLNALLERLELGGKTDQVQTTGAQLFEASRYEGVTKNGVTVTVKDGVITATGTPNINTWIQVFVSRENYQKLFKPENKIYLKTNKSKDCNYDFGIYGAFGSPIIGTIREGNSGRVLPAELPRNDTDFYFFIDVKIGTELKGSIKPIVYHDGDGTWEPYTGGKPSPSQEYQQEVKNTGKLNADTQKYEVGVKVTGKNLFDKGSVKKGYEFSSVTSDMESPKEGWFVSDFIPVIKGKVYISGKSTGSGCKLYNKDKVFVENIQAPSGALTIKEGISYFRLNGEIKDLDNVQVEYGSVATPYIPYTEQSLTLTSDRPLTKWDRLVEQGGQIGWLYGTEKYVVTGKENFSYGSENYYTGSRVDMFFEIGDATGNEAIMRDLSFVTSIWHLTDKEGFCINGKQLHIGLYNTRIGVSGGAAKEEKIKAYKEFMAKRYADGNPFEVYYKTTETEFVPLPQSEQNAIRALKTYYPTTVITVDGGEVDPDIKVTYRKEI